MKICSKCGIKKELSEFHKDKSQSSGYVASCKKCVKDYQINYRKLNIEVIKERTRIFYSNNKDIIAINRKNSNKEKQHKKDYYEKNKEKILLNKKDYYQKNKHKRHEWEKYFKLNNPDFVIKKRIREMLRHGIKTTNSKKIKPMFEYTGIAYSDYISYFKANYPFEFSEITIKGKYHIDHIIPCSAYDFNNPEHIKLCCDPKNLRIIPSKENITKTNNLDYDLIDKHGIRHLLPK